MFHVIWSILNLTILLYFSYLLVGFMIKGSAIFTKKIRSVSIFILVLGVFQIISASDNTSDRITISAEESFPASAMQNVVLEENASIDIHLLVLFSAENDTYIPIEATSFLEGFVSGFEWEFNSIEVSPLQEKNKFEYMATGILKWNLFGVTITNDHKSYRGVFTVSE
ncbi:MAG: hypothetical protein ACQESK_05650 [Bacteroidota bacterium]